MNKTNMTEDNDDDFYVSRTEQKKAVQEFIPLSEQLIALNETALLSFPLSNELLDAIQTAKRIKVGNALKRQIQFISKLVRKADYEAIQDAFEQIHQKDRIHEKLSHITEEWRDKLLEGDHDIVSEFIEKYPHCNRQKLNQLVRAAMKEKAVSEASDNTKKNVTKKRALFVFLRETIVD